MIIEHSLNEKLTKQELHEGLVYGFYLCVFNLEDTFRFNFNKNLVLVMSEYENALNMHIYFSNKNGEVVDIKDKNGVVSDKDEIILLEEWELEGIKKYDKKTKWRNYIDFLKEFHKDEFDKFVDHIEKYQHCKFNENGELYQSFDENGENSILDFEEEMGE